MSWSGTGHDQLPVCLLEEAADSQLSVFKDACVIPCSVGLETADNASRISTSLWSLRRREGSHHEAREVLRSDPI